MFLVFKLNYMIFICDIIFFVFKDEPDEPLHEVYEDDSGTGRP